MLDRISEAPESTRPARPADESDAEQRPVVVRLEPDAPMARTEARGTAIVTLAVLATLFALQAASQFIVPVVIGVLLAYALDPVVSWGARRHVPRSLGAALVLGLMIALIAWGIYALRHQAQAIIDQVPAAVEKARRALDALDTGSSFGFDSIKRATDALQHVTEQATGVAPAGGAAVVVVQPSRTVVTDYFVSGGRSVLGVVGQMTMVIFLAYFILLSGDKFKRKFVKVAGRNLESKRITVQMLDQINLSIQRFMAMLLVTNVVLAIATWAAFRMIGLDNAGTWGIAAGVLHVVPYFGPVAIAIATGVAALMQFGSIGAALVVAGVSLAIAAFVGVVLTTWMTGRIAKMNTVAVFLALLLFGWLWGVWGVLLSVPIVVILKVVSDHIEGLRPLSEFLGD